MAGQEDNNNNNNITTAETFTTSGVQSEERSSSTVAALAELLNATTIAPSSASSRPILASCKAYFDQKEFVYSVDEPDETRSLIKAGIGGENGSYNLVVDIKEHPRSLVIIYVLSNLKFPRAHRIKLCEYITRANYSLVLGNFELDMNDGEVRYKCSAAVGPEGMSFEVLERMMPASMGTMDRYYENMVKVSYGVMEPKDAVEDIENASSRQALESFLAAATDDSGTTDGDVSQSAEQ